MSQSTRRELRLSTLNDLLQGSADAGVARAFLLSMSRADLNGVADLNHIEHDGVGRHDVVRSLVEDRHPATTPAAIESYDARVLVDTPPTTGLAYWGPTPVGRCVVIAVHPAHDRCAGVAAPLMDSGADEPRWVSPHIAEAGPFDDEYDARTDAAW